MPIGYNFARAGIAQLVEQLICNQKVVGSTPTVGTNRPEFTAPPPRVAVALHFSDRPAWARASGSLRGRQLIRDAATV